MTGVIATSAGCLKKTMRGKCVITVCLSIHYADLLFLRIWMLSMAPKGIVFARYDLLKRNPDAIRLLVVNDRNIGGM